MKVRICPSCGNENEINNWNCSACGTNLREEPLSEKSSRKQLGIPAIALIVLVLSIVAIAVITLFGSLLPDVPWGSLINGISCIGSIALFVLVISGVIWLIKFVAKKARKDDGTSR